MAEQEYAPAEGLEGDLISQDQAALDAEQGGVAAPQYVPLEQFTQMQHQYQQQVAALGSQITGLQSKIDTGLNAIRRDTQAEAAERFRQQEIQGREIFLNNLRETNPELAEAQRKHFEYMDGLAAARAKQEAVTAPTPAPEPQVTQGQDQAAWQQVFGLVSDFGVDPNDPRVDYKTLVDMTIPEATRRQRFMQSIRSAMAPAAPAPPAPAAPATPQTVTPPVEGGSQRGGGYRSAEDVRNAFIAGNISSREQYKAELQKFGQST